MNLHSLNTDVRAAEDDRMLEAAKNVIALPLRMAIASVHAKALQPVCSAPSLAACPARLRFLPGDL